MFILKISIVSENYIKIYRCKINLYDLELLGDVKNVDTENNEKCWSDY